jgi:hypothetical protein
MRIGASGKSIRLVGKRLKRSQRWLILWHERQLAITQFKPKETTLMPILTAQSPLIGD